MLTKVSFGRMSLMHLIVALVALKRLEIHRHALCESSHPNLDIRTVDTYICSPLQPLLYN